MAKKTTSLFRKESVDNASSPEQLKDYLYVTKTSTWVVFAAIFIVLLGFIISGVTASFETLIPVDFKVKGEQAQIMLDTLSASDYTALMKCEAVSLVYEGTIYPVVIRGTDRAYAEVSIEDGDYQGVLVYEETDLNDLIFMSDK